MRRLILQLVCVTKSHSPQNGRRCCTLTMKNTHILAGATIVFHGTCNFFFQQDSKQIWHRWNSVYRCCINITHSSVLSGPLPPRWWLVLICSGELVIKVVLGIGFYQVRQGRTWSRSYKSPSSSPPPSPPTPFQYFGIFTLFQFCHFFANFFDNFLTTFFGNFWQFFGNF
jgi:hypothetical protein